MLRSLGRTGLEIAPLVVLFGISLPPDLELEAVPEPPRVDKGLNDPLLLPLYLYRWRCWWDPTGDGVSLGL